MKKITDGFVRGKLETLGYRLAQCLNRVKDTDRLSYARQATDMGTSKANLSKYCKHIDESKYTIMGVDNLIRFCEYYEVSADYLLGFSSDPAPVRKHDTNNLFIKQMCEYTGLTRDALSALHQRRKDSLFTVGLCYLLSARCTGFLSGIIRYIQSCLYDVVAEDDRYRRLPGSNRSTAEEGKPLFYDVIEELPLLREHFRSIVTSNEATRKKYAREMAMQIIDHEAVYRDHYTYLAYYPHEDPKSLDVMEIELLRELNGDKNASFVPLADDDPQVVHDKQVRAYLDDYYAYYADKKTGQP